VEERVATEGNLVDILEGYQVSGGLTRTRSAEAAQATDHILPPPAPSSDYGASPMNNLIIRRSSSGAGNHGPLSTAPQPMPGAISSEIMAHLKHLGPSNLASKPKQTRYNTVKIKPGSKDESARPHQGPAEGAGRKKSNPPQAGVEASLGRNAGSESAQTAKAGYGEVDRHSPEMTSHSTQTSTRAMTLHYGTYGSLAAKNGSHSTLGSLPSRHSSRSPNRQKGVTRWGSISESVIDVGGVRKVVLETTSSSEDADESNATASRVATNESSSPHTEKINDNTNDNHEQGTGQSVSSGNNKKKRRRKRKKADEGETAPLLGEGQ